MELVDDEDRLTMLEGFCGLNSVTVQAPDGFFKALFTREALELAVGFVNVQESGPALVLLASEVERLNLVRGTPLTVGDEGTFSIKEPPPDGWPADLGPGFTRLFLSS